MSAKAQDKATNGHSAILPPVAQPNHTWGQTLAACAKLARLHTWMGWIIFPAPVFYTTVLFHASQLEHFSSQTRQSSLLSISLRLLPCVMLYRSYIIAWDDYIDRDYDARVVRTKGRPLPAGDITIDAASFFILFLWLGTTQAAHLLLNPEAELVFWVTGVAGAIYPFLKRYTHLANLGGAFLVTLSTLQGYMACAAELTPIPGQHGWEHVISLLVRDAKFIVPMFLVEQFYELSFELIYGCQDTHEDIELGLKSLSILFGYTLSKPVGAAFIATSLAIMFKMCQDALGLTLALVVLLPPILILTQATVVLECAVPKTCTHWALSSIRGKWWMTSVLYLAFVAKENFDVDNYVKELTGLQF